jgi:hypothetical protein
LLVPLLVSFAGTDAEQRELQNWELRIADAHHELTHVASILPAQVTVPSPSISPAR